MSILRVSDLAVKHTIDTERVKFIPKVMDAYYGGTELPKSLMEVSWNMNPSISASAQGKTTLGGDDNSFDSQSIEIGAISTMCIYPMQNMVYDFNGTKTFHDDVFFNGLSVSLSNTNYNNEPCGPIISAPCLLGKAEYETSQDNDDNEIVNVEYLFQKIDEIWDIMNKQIFPVGSIYVTNTKAYDVNDKRLERCPLDIRTKYGKFGKWIKLEGYYLFGSGTLDGHQYGINDKITAGLPNIEGGLTFTGDIVDSTNGCFQIENSTPLGKGLVSEMIGDSEKTSLEASRNTQIYGRSSTVRAQSYTVDVWKRTDSDNEKQITYKIKYMANGGEGTMEDQVLSSGVVDRLHKNEFTRQYYSFTNWNTKKNGLGQTFIDQQDVVDLTNIPDSEISIYAQWEGNEARTSFNSRIEWADDGCVGKGKYRFHEGRYSVVAIGSGGYGCTTKAGWELGVWTQRFGAGGGGSGAFLSGEISCYEGETLHIEVLSNSILDTRKAAIQDGGTKIYNGDRTIDIDVQSGGNAHWKSGYAVIEGAAGEVLNRTGVKPVIQYRGHIGTNGKFSSGSSASVNGGTYANLEYPYGGGHAIPYYAYQGQKMHQEKCTSYEPDYGLILINKID